VLQPRGESYLSREAVGAGFAHHVRRNNLDHHVATQRRFGGHEHARHAATAKFALNVVPVQQGRAQGCDDVVHLHPGHAGESTLNATSQPSIEDGRVKTSCPVTAFPPPA